jgi:hypothetical protein
MLSPSRVRRALLIAAAALSLTTLVPPAKAQPTAAVRLRGIVETLGTDKLVLRERGGERIELALSPNLVVTEAFPLALSDLRTDSFVGAGAVPQADGTQRAIAVLIFPDAMRGTGEGHRPFDFLPQSTMTNATVSGVAASAEGRRLRVTYPGGEKIIVVPPEAPVFSIRPGTRDLLAQGAQVSLTALAVDGKPTVTRIVAGRHGFAPPY